MREIAIGRQHRQSMTNAQFGKQCIDGTDLQPSLPALVTQQGRRNVVFPIGRQQGE